MEDSEPRISRCPSIYYRPISPNDLDRLEQIHRDIFPIKYESEFFQCVVNGVGIVSWAAVDRSRPDGYSDELIGFVTAKFVLAKESEIDDLIGYDSSQGEETLIYILTLGVVETYRNHGIAMSLISGVIRYASGFSLCRGVYLHVIAYNNPAIRLYNRLMFRCVRRLNGFYLIKRQHFDAFLFVYFFNGSRSPCSPLEVAMFVVNYMKNGIKSVASKLTRKEEKGLKWLVSKDTDCVLPTQTKPNLGSSSGTFTGNVMEFNQTDTLPNAPHSLLWILEARVNVIHGLEIMTPSSERPTTLLETAEADLYEMFGRLSKVLRSIDFATLLLILHGAMTLRMFLQLFLHKKLKPYTLHMIAALNLGSVGDCPLGAWVLFCSRKLL